MRNDTNSTDRWNFVMSGNSLTIEGPKGTDSGVISALHDLATSNIGMSFSALKAHREMWEGSISHPGDEQYGIFNNDMHIFLDGDEVVLEGSYDQWGTVRMPHEQFEEFLNQFEEFLNTRQADKA